MDVSKFNEIARFRRSELAGGSHKGDTSCGRAGASADHRARAPQASLDAHSLFIECGHTLKDVPGTLRRNWAVNTFVAIAGSRFHAGSINK
jgi:hypothetical protein